MVFSIARIFFSAPIVACLIQKFMAPDHLNSGRIFVCLALNNSRVSAGRHVRVGSAALFAGSIFRGRPNVAAIVVALRSENSEGIKLDYEISCSPAPGRKIDNSHISITYLQVKQERKRKWELAIVQNYRCIIMAV